MAGKGANELGRKLSVCAVSSFRKSPGLLTCNIETRGGAEVPVRDLSQNTEVWRKAPQALSRLLWCSPSSFRHMRPGGIQSYGGGSSLI